MHPLTVVIEKKRSVRLEFAAEDQVGVNRYGGEVIMKQKAQNILHKYKLQSTENIYQKIWSEDFPHCVNTGSVIAAYSADKNDCKILLQDKSTSTILVLSSDGRKLLDSWHCKGILLACYKRGFVLDVQFVYAVERAEGEYEIVFVEGSDKDRKKRSEIKLQPVTAKNTWSHPELSVCKSKNRIAVTSTENTLDIYKKRSRHGKY